MTNSTETWAPPHRRRRSFFWSSEAQEPEFPSVPIPSELASSPQNTYFRPNWTDLGSVWMLVILPNWQPNRWTTSVEPSELGGKHQLVFGNPRFMWLKALYMSTRSRRYFVSVSLKSLLTPRSVPQKPGLRAFPRRFAAVP